MDVYTPLDQVEWRTVGILKQGQGHEYKFDLPMPLANWDVWDHWERERFHSMRDHLQPGMTLFDVGTEQGWCNLVYASFVGPENMFLIEPTTEFWPNIFATWYRNYDRDPRGFFHGLLSDKTTISEDEEVFSGCWPAAQLGPLIDRNKYQYVHEHSDNIPEMRLDDLVERSGVVPQALTIDVEGAELLVLQGAIETLREHKPLCWISIHPDLMDRDYGAVPADLHDFMTGLGYQSEHLATDHESHWRFW